MGTSTSVDALQGSGFSGRHGGRKHHHLLRVFLFALVRSFAPEPVPSSLEQPIRAAEAPAACLAVCYTETKSRTIGSHCRCSHQQFRRKGIVTRGRVCNRDSPKSRCRGGSGERDIFGRLEPFPSLRIHAEVLSFSDLSTFRHIYGLRTNISRMNRQCLRSLNPSNISTGL